MFILWTTLCIIVCVATVLVARLLKSDGTTQAPTWAIGGFFTVLFAAFAVWCCTISVDAGHVGIVHVFGNVRDKAIPPGIHVVNPFADVENMSIRTQTYTMSATSDEGAKKGNDAMLVKSKDGLEMTVDASHPFRLNPDAAVWVYKNLGPNYIDTIVRPVCRTATQEAGKEFIAENAYALERDKFSSRIGEIVDVKMKEILQNKYDNAPASVFIFSGTLLRNVGLPTKIKDAIERKLTADQKQQEMDFDILREKKEADRKEIEAKGIKKFQDIVSEGINENLLRWKGIDATKELSQSPNTKIIIIGGKDGLPLILNSAGKK